MHACGKVEDVTLNSSSASLVSKSEHFKDEYSLKETNPITMVGNGHLRVSLREKLLILNVKNLIIRDLIGLALVHCLYHLFKE